MSIKTNLENIISQKNFRISSVRNNVVPLLENEFCDLHSIKKQLIKPNYDYVVGSLVRNSFLIELVNDEISSTKMGTRWTKKLSGGKKQEAFDESDPRYATFDECKNIFSKYVSELNSALDVAKIELLCNYKKYHLIPYELPVDYIKKKTSDFHSSNNLKWFWDDEYQQTILLRSKLMSEMNPHSKTFLKILQKKINVKTFLTDRVQTGDHQTNREKRWEVHPDSVHFALRRDCLKIEKTLISQVLNFEGCPESTINLIEKIVEKTDVYRCPVSLFPLKFAELEAEILNPTHGDSKFQVGHLNPLKSNSTDGGNTHSAQNIGWISDDGNRIQGSLSLDDVRDLLQKIFMNFEKQKSKS